MKSVSFEYKNKLTRRAEQMEPIGINVREN
jgi:hypothetical protein